VLLLWERLGSRWRRLGSAAHRERRGIGTHSSATLLGLDPMIVVGPDQRCVSDAMTDGRTARRRARHVAVVPPLVVRRGRFGCVRGSNGGVRRILLAAWRRRPTHLHVAVFHSGLAKRARTGRAREGELQEQQVHDDRGEATQERVPAHGQEYGESTGRPVSRACTRADSYDTAGVPCPGTPAEVQAACLLRRFATSRRTAPSSRACCVASRPSRREGSRPCRRCPG